MCGFNYGARLYARVRRGFWFCVRLGTVFLLVLAVVEFAAAPVLIELFRKGDPEVLRIGVTALRFQCATYALNGWMMISNMMMQTTGKTIRASLLGVARQGIFLIPFVLILPAFIGLTGVQMAQPAADVMAFLSSVVLQLSLLREMAGEEREMGREQGEKNG